MSLELFKAIFSKYSGPDGADLRTKVTGLFPGNAPQGQVPPYITFSLIATPTRWTLGSSIDLPSIQFSIWDDDSKPDGVLGAAVELKKLYDDALLTVGGFHTVRADRRDERLLENVDKGWEDVVSYEYFLQTN